jgi:RNA polymerase sigma factor (sigma-70 family)
MRSGQRRPREPLPGCSKTTLGCGCSTKSPALTGTHQIFDMRRVRRSIAAGADRRCSPSPRSIACGYGSVMASRRQRPSTAEKIETAARPVLLACSAGDAFGRQQLDDLVATVVEKVLRRLKSEPPVRDLAQYSKQTARTVFTNWLRDLQKYPEQAPPLMGSEDPSPEWGDILPDQGMTPASLVVRADDQRRHALDIRDALAGLSATERAVLYCRYQVGLSAAKVAELLGYKSQGVVNDKIRRIRKKLADDLPLSLQEPPFRARAARESPLAVRGRRSRPAPRIR